MFAQTSILLLLSCSASTLAQLTIRQILPFVTSPVVADGVTIAPPQFTEIAEDLFAAAQSQFNNPGPVASQVVQALTKAGYSLDEIVGDLLAATPTATGVAAYLNLVTGSPVAPSLAIETALPTSVKNAYDAYNLNVLCQERAIARQDLNLPSDAVATQCAAIMSSASVAAQAARTASTGGAALARPTGISGLAGGMFAAGMVGAAAALL